MKRGLFVLVLAALAGLALGQGAMVRVAHLSPDAPAVDVLVNGAVAFPGLANGQQAMADLKGGTYEIAIAPAGTSTEPTEAETLAM